ncbi:hypothetical protein OJF2_02240 [Aquisphaera giovannonii]|uniref:Uncharacterized protein n=1 Tax=Aquisphaera giovannonii TaxID=406548 RepID=A0A5B9VUI4_9BACT|nr:hypothetical protein OJF2_02240 [Aquisphaera giovannonii]
MAIEAQAQGANGVTGSQRGEPTGSRGEPTGGANGGGANEGANGGGANGVILIALTVLGNLGKPVANSFGFPWGIGTHRGRE